MKKSTHVAITVLSSIAASIGTAGCNRYTDPAYLSGQSASEYPEGESRNTHRSGYYGGYGYYGGNRNANAVPMGTSPAPASGLVGDTTGTTTTAKSAAGTSRGGFGSRGFFGGFGGS